MAISKQEVEKIAKLARLRLTKEEIAKMQKDLTTILDYFELLKNAPTIEIPISKFKNLNLRKDEVISSQLAKEIVKAAPHKKDGYIKVRAVL